MKQNSRNLYLRNIRKKWKENGICSRCGSRPASHPRTHCELCIERNKKKRNPSRKDKYFRLKSNAKKRGIEFSMTSDDFVEWYEALEQKCHYCNISKEDLESSGRKKAFMTIDRKDNEGGYHLSNICLSCHRCNNLKSNFFTESQWIEIANKYITPNLSKYHCLDD